MIGVPSPLQLAYILGHNFFMYHSRKPNGIKQTSNMTPFICYINNTVIKLPIYFNSHRRIDEQIMRPKKKRVRASVSDVDPIDLCY
jgi:hypothetical protein